MNIFTDSAECQEYSIQHPLWKRLLAHCISTIYMSFISKVTWNSSHRWELRAFTRTQLFFWSSQHPSDPGVRHMKYLCYVMIKNKKNDLCTSGRPVITSLTKHRADDAKVLTCEAEGVPEPTFQWSVNNTNVRFRSAKCLCVCTCVCLKSGGVASSAGGGGKEVAKATRGTKWSRSKQCSD